MKTYTAANDSEARSLHDGTQTLIVVPMEPQPCEKSIADYRFDWCYRGVFDYGSKGKNWLEFAVYVPGDVVGAKEAATDAIRTRLSIVSVAAKRQVQGAFP